MNRDGQVRVFPPVVALAAATARGAGEAAFQARSALGVPSAAAAFHAAAGAAFARMQAAWLVELQRLGASAAVLGYRAEASAQDYVRTDQHALAPVGR